MRVCLSNKQKDLPIPTKLIKRLAVDVVHTEAAKSFPVRVYSEVGIHFVSSREISLLHKNHFDDPTPTDCISFPIDNSHLPNDSDLLLGDVFVCPKIALEYAAKHGTDPDRELLLYVIHGLLHLLGYDDIDPKDRAKMRAAERRHLRHLLECGGLK